MSFGHALYQLLIGPLELLFETVFSLAYRVVKSPGLTIVFLSLAMNFLVLPLYRRADAIQTEQRDKALQMKPWVDHIKKTFRGDERFMMLETYYREVGYKPTDALKGSVSLLLEVPFFIAAYRFLSGLSLLNGVSFGPIADLGAPDGLIRIGGLAINLLPILMTLINVAAAAIYMKGFPLRNKLQMYGMALVFLVLLYGSPAGLVFYWTLNNLFSLGKNIFYKLKHPKRVFAVACSAIGALGLIFVLFVHPMATTRRQLLLVGALLLLQLPLLLQLLLPVIRKKRAEKGRKPTETALSREDSRGFLYGCVFLALLTGLLIPSAIEYASPEEFINAYVYRHPIWYVVNALLIAVGTFVIWFGIFYRLAGTKGKRAMGIAVWIGSVCAAVNYLFFGKSHGNLSEMLQYDVYNAPSHKEMLINLLVMIALAAILYLVWKKKSRIVRIVVLAMCLAVVGIGTRNLIGVGVEVADANERVRRESGIPEIRLSKTGNNVIVLMLDRAISEFVPFVMEEKPELMEQFAGFTFYPNTLAFGGATVIGGPPLFGGYEYRPVNLNARSDETLSDKHDESLKVMPAIFSEHGYHVTVSDPPLAGYSLNADLRVFDDYPDFTVFNATGKLDQSFYENADAVHALRDRNFFCYSVYRIAPVMIQSTLYNRGMYNAVLDESSDAAETLPVQERTGLSTSNGISATFRRTYSVLVNLPTITKAVDDGTDTFLLMGNDTTHYGNILKEPEYEPALHVDNTEYDKAHPTRTSWDGTIIRFTTESNVVHYHALMASLIRLGKWMDDLREQGVYDNTRIILVSDHGHAEDILPDTRFGEEEWESILRFSSFLMVKDFNSRTFTVDDRFMTQADVPTLALKDLIENPVNPFTGNPIDDAAKSEPVQYLRQTGPLNIPGSRDRKQFPGSWVRFEGHNIFDVSKWKALDGELPAE